MVDDILLHALVQTFEQRHATRETLFEIYLAAHRRQRDRFYFIAHTGAHRQLVNHLCLDERRVHIDAYKPSVAAEHIVFLE